jgi:hypothetical protein
MKYSLYYYEINKTKKGNTYYNLYRGGREYKLLQLDKKPLKKNIPENCTLLVVHLKKSITIEGNDNIIKYLFNNNRNNKK